MKNHWLTGLNILCILTFLSLMCAFQASLWMQVLGGFPPPLIWIVVLTFVTLHRHVGEAVFMTYLMTCVISAYTAEPFEHFLLNNMICLVFILLIKNRIYWPSPNYFMLMTAAATALHFLMNLLLSQFLDANPLRSPEFFHWMISFLLTLLISIPIYQLLKWFDRITQRDVTAESTGGLV